MIEFGSLSLAIPLSLFTFSTVKSPVTNWFEDLSGQKYRLALVCHDGGENWCHPGIWHGGIPYEDYSTRW
jgi:hypothetical protein